MIWLLIDTSCPRAVVALSVEGKIAAHRYLTETKKHSEMLSPSVNEVLAEAKLQMSDLQGVAVGKGPGSFIGVRVAMAFAKGLCVALDIPLVGVGTLSSLGHEPGLPEGKGVAAIDARRGEYYVQTFERTLAGQVIAVDAPHLYPAAELKSLAEQSSYMIGTSLVDVASSCPSKQIILMDGPSADGLLQACLARINKSDEIVDETLALVPDYVRDPDAKPMPV